MLKSTRKDAIILGVRLNSTSTSLVLRSIQAKLAKKAKFYIVTPNPEIVLLASEDRLLAKILNSADFSLPDGVGLTLAARFLAEPRLNLLPGRKVMLELFRLANSKKLKVFLLGSTGAVVVRCCQRLEREFPGIKVEGDSGPILDKNAKAISERECEVEKDTVDKINKFAPDLLFVAFGAPKQEKWVAKWLPKLAVGGAMVIGGALDYFSGEKKLPPEFFEKTRLEWLWRLFTEPRRAKRIVNAVFIFPTKVFWYQLRRYLERNILTSIGNHV